MAPDDSPLGAVGWRLGDSLHHMRAESAEIRPLLSVVVGMCW